MISYVIWKHTLMWYHLWYHTWYYIWYYIVSMISCYKYDIIYDIMRQDMISYIISYIYHRHSICTVYAAVPFQPPIFPRHSVLMQSMVGITLTGGICSSAVLVSWKRDWTNSMPYSWSSGCLTCSKTTCHTEQAGQRAGISKKHTVFFTRYATFCFLVGLRTSVTRALSMTTMQPHW